MARKTRKSARKQPSQSARRAAHVIAGTVKRVAHATRKVTKVARVLGRGARAVVRPDAKVDVTLTSRSVGEAPQQFHFVLHDGRQLRSIYELVDELETMSEDQFRLYANEFKNDFANWIRDVFDERQLAEEIAKMQHRVDMQRALLKHLVRELRRRAMVERKR